MLGSVLLASACTGTEDTAETTTSPPPPPSTIAAPTTTTLPPRPITPPATTISEPEPEVAFPAGWTELGSGSLVFALGVVEAAASGNGTVVAVGWNGALPAAWVSEDGVTWRRAALPDEVEEAEMLDVAADDHGFVAVGWSTYGSSLRGGSTVWTSTDGSEWSQVVLDDGGELFGIAAVPAGFLAVGTGPTSTPVAYASPDGSNWQQVPAVPWEQAGLTDIAAGATGITAIDDDHVSWFTEDLVTWEQGEWMGEAHPADLTFHAGRFLAVGSLDGRPAIWSSPDGLTWDAKLGFESLGLDPAYYESVVPIPVPVPTPPGVEPDPAPPPPPPQSTLRLRWIASAGNRLLAGRDSDEPDLVSEDAVAWSDRFGWSGADEVFDIAGIVAGGPGLVMVGESFDSDGLSVWISANGVEWTRSGVSVDPLDDLQLTAIVRGGPGLVASGATTTGAVMLTSSDGTTWERVADLGPATVTALTTGGPGFVAVGVDDENQVTAWTSADGSNWDSHPQLANDSFLLSVTTGGPGLVAVGVDNAFLPLLSVAWVSCDGVSWREVPRDQANLGGAFMISVATDAHRLVAVGVDGAWTSTNGINWILHDFDGFARRVVSLDGRFLAAGESVWTSEDGETWRDTDGPLESLDIQPFNTLLLPHNDGIVVTTSDFGFEGEGPRIWLSADGEVFEEIPTDHLSPAALISGVVSIGTGLIVTTFDLNSGTRVWSWQPEDAAPLEAIEPSPSPSSDAVAECELEMQREIETAGEALGELPAGHVPRGSLAWMSIAVFAEDVTAVIADTDDRVSAHLSDNPNLDRRAVAEYSVIEYGAGLDELRAQSAPGELESAYAAYVDALGITLTAMREVLDSNSELNGSELDAALDAALEDTNIGLAEACRALQDIFDANGISGDLDCPFRSNFDEIARNL